MASAKIYLDKRSKKQDGTHPLKITISHKGATARISLGISVRSDQWNEAAGKVCQHPNKEYLNAYLLQERTAIGNALLALQQRGDFKGCTAIEVRDMVLRYLHPEEEQRPVTFAMWYAKFEKLHENPRTRAIYHATWVQIEHYDKNASRLRFEDINKAWLEGFFASMAEHSPSVNARNIHLRNIRAAFNNAIDNGVTTCYPFRRLKIRPVATAKRNLKPQALRALFSAPVPDWQQKYIDIFKLSFLLIGINIGDLLELPAGADMDGRISFNRKKTRRLYSIKVEPEARAIIDKYRGTVHLLNVADGCSTYRHFANRLNLNLHAISPSVTTYWARHSWATIAASLDIPDDTIALALGHAGANSTTSIYIERDRRKIDAANRRVIDWVLYNKE